MEPPSPKFDEDGLVPCVIQDWRSGEVLTLAYMNEEALRLSRETGELHLFSRSRNELWHKGATSGNTQAVKALRFDCDQDAVLALVEPAGPACHTGERTCFFSGDVEPPAMTQREPGRGTEARRGQPGLRAVDHVQHRPPHTGGAIHPLGEAAADNIGRERAAVGAAQRNGLDPHVGRKPCDCATLLNRQPVRGALGEVLAPDRRGNAGPGLGRADEDAGDRLARTRAQ